MHHCDAGKEDKGRAHLILTLVDGSNGSQPHGVHKARVAFAELHLKEIHNNTYIIYSQNDTYIQYRVHKPRIAFAELHLKQTTRRTRDKNKGAGEP